MTSSTLFTAEFWISAAERAVKSGAWSLAATLGAGQIGVLEADWPQALSVAGMAMVLSLLGSIGSDAATGGGPSITSSETLTGRAAAPTGRPARDKAGETVSGPADSISSDGTPVVVKPAHPSGTES